MNCPGCGWFMTLIFAGELGYDPGDGAAFYWCCQNHFDCLQFEQPIAAPEYNWLHDCQSIPEKAFVEDPKLRAECDEMKQRYLNRPARRQ